MKHPNRITGLAPGERGQALLAQLRTLRIGDGPDEVHNRTIARLELAKYREKNHPATKAAA